MYMCICICIYIYINMYRYMCIYITLHPAKVCGERGHKGKRGWSARLRDIRWGGNATGLGHSALRQPGAHVCMHVCMRVPAPLATQSL